MTNIFILHKVPTSMLLGFGCQYGALFSKEWNADSSGYIHSRVYSRFLINLSITSFILSRALKFITFCTSRKLQFLYFLAEGFVGRFLNSDNAARFWKQNFFLLDRWIPGVLTNYKVIKEKLKNLKRYTNFFNYANVFIYLNTPKSLNIASAEARVAKLPSIGLVDTDNGFSPFSYSIPSNNKTFSIFYTYYSLFFQSSKIGWTLWNVSCKNIFYFKIKKIVRKFSYLLRRAVKRSGLAFTRWKKLQTKPSRVNKFKRKNVFFRQRKRRGGSFNKSLRNKTIKLNNNFKFSAVNLDLFFRLKKIKKKKIGVKKQKKLYFHKNGKRKNNNFKKFKIILN